MDIIDQQKRAPHLCHYPGCDKPVPPALWGCHRHWYTLPKVLRDEVWRNYRPGQEVDKCPSAAYIKTAAKVDKWCRDNESARAPFDLLNPKA